MVAWTMWAPRVANSYRYSCEMTSTVSPTLELSEATRGSGVWSGAGAIVAGGAGSDAGGRGTGFFRKKVGAMAIAIMRRIAQRTRRSMRMNF